MMEKINMFISVKSLSELKGDATYIVSGWNDKKEFVRFFDKEYKGLSVILNYPFNGASFTIPKAKSLNDVIKPIADFYKNKVYNDPEKNGVWGHGIKYLYIEKIIINDDLTVEVAIGN